MATHVLNIAFDFDDDKVRDIAEKTIEKDMDTIVKNIILDHLAPRTRTLFSNPKDRDWNGFEELLTQRIDAILYKHKDEIIELAATKLSESYKRTKIWKQRTEEVMKI